MHVSLWQHRLPEKRVPRSFPQLPFIFIIISTARAILHCLCSSPLSNLTELAMSCLNFPLALRTLRHPVPSLEWALPFPTRAGISQRPVASSLMTLFLHFDPRTPNSFLSLTCRSLHGWVLLLNHFSCSSSHPPPGMFCWAISWMFPCRGPTGPSHWRGRTLTSFAPSHHLCLLTPSFPSVIPRDRTYAEDHPAALPDSRVTSPVNSPLLGLLMALPGYRCFLYVLIVSHRYYFHGSYVSSLPSPHHYLNTAMRLTCPQFFSFSLSCSETSGACSYLLCRAYSPLFPDWWPSPALSIGTSHPRCQFLPNAQPWFQPCSLCSEDIKCVSVLAPHHPVLARHHSFSLNPAINPIAWMNPQGITEWKKTISKGSILCDFIYKTFWNDKVFFLSSWRVVDSQCCVSFQV